MTLLQTIIIAIVEGLTEFLPVSSTGHMLIAENLLGVQNSAFVRAFTIIIQFAAILELTEFCFFIRTAGHNSFKSGHLGCERLLSNRSFGYLVRNCKSNCC